MSSPHTQRTIRILLSTILLTICGFAVVQGKSQFTGNQKEASVPTILFQNSGSYLKTISVFSSWRPLNLWELFSSHKISSTKELATPPTAIFAACGSITTASSPILYRDASVSNVTDEYVAYKITNTTGSAITDLWVRLTPCVACNVTLSTNEDGLYHVGPLAAGAMTTVYFYVHTTAATNTAQALTLDLFEGNPSMAGTLVCGPNPFNYTIEETIKANANKPDTVVISSGDCYVMTVTGMTGTIGSANGSVMAFTPSANPTFNADGYQLTSVSIDLNGTVTNDTLYLSGLASPDKPYKITYTFCPPSPLAAPVITPITWISSGMQIKHTDPDTGMGGTVFINSLKSVSPTGTVAAGTKLTYTIAISNTGSTAADGMTLTDAIPANTTYVASSTTLNGAAVADVAGAMPYATSKEIHSTGAASGTIAANATATVSFMVTVNNPTAATSVSNFASYVGTMVPSSNTNTVTTPICTPPATPTISGTLAFCEGGNSTLTATGTGTFMWFKDTVMIAGQSASTLSVTAAGSYTVKVTSAAGCPSAVSAPAVVTVNLCADLAVTKTNGASSVTENTSTTYTLTLLNNGPSAANGSKISDPAVTGLTKTSLGTCTAANGAVCPVAGSGAGQLNIANLEAGTVVVPTLPNGGSISFTVTATVTATKGSTVTNTFTATPPATVTDPTPATASDTDTVDPEPTNPHNPANVGISDQKAGSLLVFPYYNSKSGTDTRMTISNTGEQTVAIHMYFLDSSCNQADQIVCLTPNASQTFLASEYDPENTGYLLAVAVSDSLANWNVQPGCPVPYNGLIGNAFVKEGNYNDNYGAEAFWAHGSATDIAACDTVNWTATLNFNGSCGVGGYDYQPTQHVAEIQSPNDSVGQKIIVVGLKGTIGGTVGGSAQEGIGIAYNDGEKPGSYASPFGSGCQRSFTIDTRTPRVPGGLGLQPGINNSALIPSGRIGTLKWSTSGSVGLILTPKGTNKWSGIRPLHKTMITKTNTLTVPILSVPQC